MCTVLVGNLFAVVNQSESDQCAWISIFRTIFCTSQVLCARQVAGSTRDSGNYKLAQCKCSFSMDHYTPYCLDASPDLLLKA